MVPADIGRIRRPLSYIYIYIQYLHACKFNRQYAYVLECFGLLGHQQKIKDKFFRSNNEVTRRKVTYEY